MKRAVTPQNKLTCAALLLAGMLLAACTLQPGAQGRVSDQDGSPVSGAQVSLKPAGADTQAGSTVLTDADGEYHLEDRASGKYTLSITWENNPSCPGLEGGLPLTRIDDFVVAYSSRGFGRVLIAVKEFDYQQGQGTRLDLKLPCKAPTPVPTLPPSVTPEGGLTHTPTATEIVPTAFAEEYTPTPASNDPHAFCPTEIPAEATAFAGLGELDPPGSALTGTTWEVTDSQGSVFEVQFLPGGVLRTDPTEFGSSCADWRQSGNRVFFRFSFRNIELHGEIDGVVMQGTARAVVTGTEWTWSGTRK